MTTQFDHFDTEIQCEEFYTEEHHMEHCSWEQDQPHTDK